MPRKLRLAERRAVERPQLAASPPAHEPAEEAPAPPTIARLASSVGNHAFGRLARAGSGILPDGTAHPDVADTIAQTRGRGEPLADDVRKRVGAEVGDPLTDVRIHRDHTAHDLTRAVAARAFTTRADVYFGAGEYRPGSADGDALLTHELTHVVQQRGAPASGPLAVSEPGDKLELEADAAAGGVRKAPGSVSRSPARAIQRFEEAEHRAIGDLGSKTPSGGTHMVELAPGFSVTYGEMVAMAGDHFRSAEEMTRLAGNPGRGAGTREEIEYVLTVEIRGQRDEKDRFSKEAVHAAEARYYELASKNQSHFLNPREGDRLRGVQDAVRAHEGGKAMGAAANYHDGHRAALLEAARAGKAGESINQALVLESFCNHFLTDAFSAGHTRTPRQTLSDYWHAKVPMFFVNFEMYMAEKIAKYINDHNWRGDVASVDLIMMGGGGAGDLWQTGSLATIKQTLKEKGMPEITFGDIVSGALHDYDNVHGVDVMVNGKQMRVLGDGQLVQHGQETKQGHETLQTAADAVRTSLEEVHEAYADGKSGVVGEPVVDKFLARHDQLFAAERMLPQVLPEYAQGSKQVKWDYDTPAQLLGDQQFKEAVAITAHDKASELQSIGDTLDADYKREAFKKGFLAKLEGGPGDVAKTLHEVIDYTPDTGGGAGGHNQDDNAVAYWKEAKRRRALGTLTLPQKTELVRDVLAGATVGEEDTMIVELLDANHEDAAKILQKLGWHWIWEDVDGDDRRNLIRKIGPSFWRTQSFDAKRREIKWLADGPTPDDQQETMIVILRTCTPEEVVRLDSELNLLFDLDGDWDKELRRMKAAARKHVAGARH